MKELVRSNDAVLLSFIEALFREAGIEHVILDAHMSIVEGSVGILPRRLMVAEDQLDQAKRLLKDAGLEHVAKSK